MKKAVWKVLVVVLVVVGAVAGFAACSNSVADASSWGEWEVTTAPTCMEKGVETRVNKNDASVVETRTVFQAQGMDGHDFVPTGEIVEPTDITRGYEYHVCTHCGLSIAANYTAPVSGETN